MKLVQDFHVTSCFVGGNARKLESKFCTTFNENQSVYIDLVAILFVPYKIITGVVNVKKPKNLQIENEYPHMTLMTGDWAAKYSNDLCQDVFGKNGAFSDLYDDDGKRNIWQNGKFGLWSCQSKVLKSEKKKLDVYLIRPKKCLQLFCISEAFFSKKSKSKKR